jgi:hypothetical protein
VRLQPRAKRPGQTLTAKRRHAVAPARRAWDDESALDSLFLSAAELLGSQPFVVRQAAVEAAMDYLAECEEFMSALEGRAGSQLGRPRRQDANADDTVFDDLMVDLMIAVQERVAGWIRLDPPGRAAAR